jgi:hypothetical protein
MTTADGLTAAVSISAFRRFMAKQGNCAQIYSENVVNFTEAQQGLQEFSKLFHSRHLTRSKHVQQTMATSSITPPHAGRLLEVEVPSVKEHLHRVTRETAMTSEKFNTLITQTEASKLPNSNISDPYVLSSYPLHISW